MFICRLIVVFCLCILVVHDLVDCPRYILVTVNTHTHIYILYKYNRLACVSCNAERRETLFEKKKKEKVIVVDWLIPMSNEPSTSQGSNLQKCGVCKPCMNPHWHKRCLALPATNQSRKSSKSQVKNEPKEKSFVDKLRDIIQSDGSMRDAQSVPQFLKICDIANEWGHRKAILKVLQASSNDPLEAFVSQGGLLKMEVWLNDALPDARQKFIALMLTTLSHVPITLASLRKPCELGKAVGKLRKMTELEESIRSQARILVMKWKSLIESKVESAPKVEPSSSAPKSEPSSPKGASGLGDVDIFNVKPQKKQVDAVPAQQNVRVVTSNAAKSQMTDVKKSTSVARVSASPLDSLSGPDLTSRPQQPLSRPRTVLTPAANGLPLATGHMTAAQRAKLAADSVPEEPPRQKKKAATRKISWASEKELVSVRLFLKDQPPCKANRDATLDDIAKKEKETPETHENFEHAAKLEHHSEAQALKDFKAQEDQERRGIEQRLQAMRPAVAWRDPPMIPKDIFEEYGVAARGEESTEKTVRMQQTALVAGKVYTKDTAPPFPEEAPVGASMPMQPMHLIPKIPLSLEEARKLAEKRATIPMNSTGSTTHRPPEQKRPAAVRPPPTQQTPFGVARIATQHRPMASQKFGGPMLGLHGANKAQQPRKMTAQAPTMQQPMVTTQHGPRPMLGNDTRPPCAFFNRPKGCIHGDKCKFAHVRLAPGQQPAEMPIKRPPTTHDGGGPRKMVKHV